MMAPASRRTNTIKYFKLFINCLTTRWHHLRVPELVWHLQDPWQKPIMGICFWKIIPRRASFVLSLPLGVVETEDASDGLTETDVVGVGEEVTSVSEFGNRKFTILLVEDNIELLNLTREALSVWFKVIRAGNGKEALEILAHQGVDVIVSDIMMPEMDGLELCNHVKSDMAYSHIPVVLLTAKTTLESKVEGLESGADVYLEKPFSISSSINRSRIY